MGGSAWTTALDRLHLRKLDNQTQRALAPAFKLGWSLASRHVPVRDIGFAGGHPSNAVAIIRRQVAGSPSCTAARSAQPFELRAETIAAIPTGALTDSRRRIACGPPRQRPTGWQALCAGGEAAAVRPDAGAGGDDD